MEKGKQRATKKSNSDWNQIIEEENKSVFLKIFKNQSQRTSTKGMRTKKSMKGIKMVNKGEESKTQKEDQQMNDETSQLRYERMKRLNHSEVSEFYQSLIPNQVSFKMNQMVPCQFYDSIECSDSRIYGGKFTQKGNLFYASSQSHIMLFNTQDPYKWRLKKRILAQEIHWTVSDMDVDTNEQYLIYSTLSPVVQLVDLETLSAKSERLAVSTNANTSDGWYGQSGGAIMSLKFSGDNKEIVAGTKNAEVLVYDLVSNRVSTKVTAAHDDEINSVCFANRNASNIIFTGSDDSLVKVWDRRCLGAHNSAQGAFVGHSEGITHVASKHDGILLASNGKDQLLKVWDIRMMVSSDELSRVRLPRSSGFDYRWGSYPLAGRQVKHEDDRSLFTFMGHEVMQTLIRCYFSPLETTGQRYVYSGSADGRIFIFDLITGKEAQILQSYQCREVARDVSWHPSYPVLASTSFNGQIDIWTLQNIDMKATKTLFTQKDYDHMLSDDGDGTHEYYDDEDEEQEMSLTDSSNSRSGNMSSLILSRIRSLIGRRALAQLRTGVNQIVDDDSIDEAEENDDDDQYGEDDFEEDT